ncbi:hypothetical protein [Streptomyces sp. NPDC005374]|uniref:hypothetical protein n=1 Tax=Streptomyces sp. NPDC005374 TaxID=3364713 RepID=UPI0036C05939
MVGIVERLVPDELLELFQRVVPEAPVRSPTSYTNPLKAQGVIDYGYSDTNLADCEEDHMARVLLRHQDRQHQGRCGDQAEGRRLRRHHHMSAARGCGRT